MVHNLRNYYLIAVSRYRSHFAKIFIMASQPLTIHESNEGEPISANDWVDFCKKEVEDFASKFAISWKQYLVNNPSREEILPKTVVQKVCELFPQILEESLQLSNDKVQNGHQNIVTPTVRSVSSNDILEAASDDSPESPSVRINHKPFFRRLSFKGLRKGKSLFLKQHSDEVELSPHHERQSGRGERSKLKTVKLSVECIREGNVQLLNGDTSEGQLNWAKSRMALVKLGAGHILEFYSPPKTIKPKTGIFCLSINEVRETTEIEMPDLRNTFVIKTDNGSEWVIEAHDHEDMKGWLTTIVSYCSLTSTSTTDFLNPSLGLPYLKEDSGQSFGGIMQNGDTIQEHPPDLPPRLMNLGLSSSSLSMNSSLRRSDLSRNSRSLNGLGEVAATDENAHTDADVEFYAQLRNYPWFHGMMSRCDAAGAVLQDFVAGHGTFLVRQSETRKGEYVLTFNYQGRAKHLRMTISPDGMCKVQHMSFTTIFDLLEYFRENHIPLESGGSSDVTLAEFVISEDLSDRQQLPLHTSNERRVLTPPGSRELATHGGSVRVTTVALERMQYEANNSGSSSGRAVENTYTYT